MGCLNTDFYLFLRGQKRAFFGGSKSPILARGHMGKPAVFNQIDLYLEPPKRGKNPSFRASYSPHKNGAPRSWSTLKFPLSPLLNSERCVECRIIRGIYI